MIGRGPIMRRRTPERCARGPGQRVDDRPRAEHAPPNAGALRARAGWLAQRRV